jgi:hypothetical protein
MHARIQAALKAREQDNLGEEERVNGNHARAEDHYEKAERFYAESEESDRARVAHRERLVEKSYIPDDPSERKEPTTIVSFGPSSSTLYSTSSSASGGGGSGSSSSSSSSSNSDSSRDCEDSYNRTCRSLERSCRSCGLL